MKVLLIVPTYGRIPFLNRTLASFMSQDYDDKEMVIINDDKNVEICCEQKGVTCINLSRKILVGNKRNLAVTMGNYELYMPHDDDDLFLPSRISTHVKIHTENPDIHLYHSLTCYLIYGSMFKPSGSGPSCISFTKKGWFDVGGYNHSKNAGEDQEFIGKFRSNVRMASSDSVDYVYNFGGLNYHLSDTSDTEIEKIAHKQLVDLNLLGKKYYMEPDFDEYNKFLELERMYKEKQEPINVRHISMGKIEIVR